MRPDESYVYVLLGRVLPSVPLRHIADGHFARDDPLSLMPAKRCCTNGSEGPRTFSHLGGERRAAAPGRLQ